MILEKFFWYLLLSARTFMQLRIANYEALGIFRGSIVTLQRGICFLYGYRGFFLEWLLILLLRFLLRICIYS
jgi:hypothetical protein